MRILFSFFTAVGILPLEAFHIPQGEISAGGSFNSEYVDRGRKSGVNDCTFGVQTSYNFLGGDLQLGSANRLAMSDSEIVLGNQSYRFSMSQTSSLIGYRRTIGRDITLHLGYIAKNFTNLHALIAYFNDNNELRIIRNSSEIYFMLNGENAIPWTLAVHYDFDREEILTKASLNYNYDLNSFHWNHFSLAANVGFGFDQAKKPWGIRHYFDHFVPTIRRLSTEKSYCFWDTQLAIIYQYTAHSAVNVAFNYAGNSASKGQWANCLFGKHHQMCWVSVGVHFDF